MILSANEVAHLAALHWTLEDDRIIATAICLAESGGNTDAIGRSVDAAGNVGNFDHGLWQISNKWHQLRGDGTPGRLLLAGASWRDPYVNARLAREVYDEAKRAGKDPWIPWHVYTSPTTGSFTKYLEAARIAVKAPWAPPAYETPNGLTLAALEEAAASGVRKVLGQLDRP